MTNHFTRYPCCATFTAVTSPIPPGGDTSITLVVDAVSRSAAVAVAETRGQRRNAEPLVRMVVVVVVVVTVVGNIMENESTMRSIPGTALEWLLVVIVSIIIITIIIIMNKMATNVDMPPPSL